MISVPDKVVLYGTGLEGEKFYCKHNRDFDIVYCLDQRKRERFHGIDVYQIEQKRDQIHRYYIIVSVGIAIYEEIKKLLECYQLEEYRDFIHVSALGKKIVFVYGNCHMGALCRYLNLNDEFRRQYYIKYYSIMQNYFRPETELGYCDVLITQDIRKDNCFGEISCEELVREHKTGQNIIVPNIYGYNMFFPQINYESDNKKNRDIERHLTSDAIDMGQLSEQAGTVAYNFAYMMVGCGDAYIDAMHHKGMSIKDIEKNILEKQIWSKADIQNNFDSELSKIKGREKLCSFLISDSIEENYQKYRLFYSPSHPANIITKIKGKRILEILGLEPDGTEPDIDNGFDNSLGADELPIYGCVKKALGLQFEQKYSETVVIGHWKTDLKLWRNI